MKFLRQLSLLSVSFAISFSSHAQVIGSHDNSDMIPSEAKASTLSTGMVAGDVNLFTGDYNTSMSLGGVSTPGGLSFNLNLSYSSTYTAGTSPTVAAGIPYGEGWNVSIPTISVANAAYFSFTQYQEHYYSNGASALDTNYFDQITGEKNGDLFWYSPTVNIPGYANGKAVFKHLEDNGNVAVFVLNKFDKYVELRFDGTRWEVYLDNGLVYEMGTALVAYRTPNNQRVLSYNSSNASQIDNEVSDVNDNNSYGNSAEMVKNSIEPKQEVTTWYCSQIRNKNIEFQTINFEYEKFGGFNFFKEYEQYVLSNQIGAKLFNLTDPTPGGFSEDFTAYRDILLTKVTANDLDSEIEVLDLNYQSAQLNNTSLIGGNMLDHTDANVGRKDSLYSYQIIYEQGITGGFNNEWNRYLHGKADSAFGYMTNTINSSNPYIVEGNKYVRQTDQGATNSLPFNHGFLVTKRIPSTDIISGDIYEVKTKVIDLNGTNNRMGNGTIDISVVTGACGVRTNTQGGLITPHTFDGLDGNLGANHYSIAGYQKNKRGTDL